MGLETGETRGIGGVYSRVQRSTERWAVIIGISKYRSLAREHQLRYAAADARALHAFLRTPQGGAFAPDHVRLLLDEEATLRAMKSALGNFLLSAGRDDMVMIFFAGHGQVEQGRTDTVYLLPYDVDPKDLFATAYAVQELRAALSRRVYAQRVVMIVDACHSGSLGQADVLTRGASDVLSRYLTAIGSSENGRAVLTASSPTELSQEGEKWGGGHGVFTHHLLEALKGGADVRADGGSDGIVSLHEAFEYTLRNVARDTKNAQHPSLSGAYNIPLAVCDVDRARKSIEQQRARPEPRPTTAASKPPAQKVAAGQTFELQVEVAPAGALLKSLDRARQAMRRKLKATLTASGFALSADQLETLYRQGKEVDFENGDTAVRLKMAFTAPK